MRALAAILLLACAGVTVTAAASSRAENEYAAGQAAFELGDTAAAEAHFRQVLEIDRNHVRALIGLGTIASWGDGRLDEARELFQRAVEADPGNREARLGLARVMSWQGHLVRSIDIYRELRAENRADREATLGLARALAWAGRYRDSEELYREQLQRDSGDVGAMTGLAATLSWEGRLEESLALYEEAVARDPSNREALAGRARVLMWQGRTPQALEAAQDALRVNPNDASALKIDRDVREELRPGLSASSGIVRDSDHNWIETQRLAMTWPVTASLVTGVSYDRFGAVQPDRFGVMQPLSGGALHLLDTRLEAFRVFGSWRAARDVTLSASAGVDRIEGDLSSDTYHGAGSAGADWRIDDRWSLSGSFSREIFAATAESLEARIGVSALTASATFTPISRLVTRLTLQRSAFSDPPAFTDPATPPGFSSSGNRRYLVAGYVRWAVPLSHPRMGVSWSGRYFECDRPGLGYFCPDSFLANLIGVDLSDRIGKRFGWSVQGTFGFQNTGGDTDPAAGYQATASWDFDHGITLEGYAGGTNLALQTGSGFRSTEHGVRLRWRFGTPAPRAAAAGEGH